MPRSQAGHGASGLAGSQAPPPSSPVPGELGNPAGPFLRRFPETLSLSHPSWPPGNGRPAHSYLWRCRTCRCLRGRSHWRRSTPRSSAPPCRTAHSPRCPHCRASAWLRGNRGCARPGDGWQLQPPSRPPHSGPASWSEGLSPSVAPRPTGRVSRAGQGPGTTPPCPHRSRPAAPRTTWGRHSVCRAPGARPPRDPAETSAHPGWALEASRSQVQPSEGHAPCPTAASPVHTASAGGRAREGCSGRAGAGRAAASPSTEAGGSPTM